MYNEALYIAAYVNAETLVIVYDVNFKIWTSDRHALTSELIQ